MAHNTDQGWTWLTDGSCVKIVTLPKAQNGPPAAYIRMEGPKGGVITDKRLTDANMAELIAALIIASDDKTLRTAAKMVQRVPGQPKPFLTRGEIWAVINGYDVDNPQTQFGDSSAGDQIADIMHAMQPEPGKPPSYAQLEDQLAAKKMHDVPVGGEVRFDKDRLIYARLAGEDAWVEVTDPRRRLVRGDEVLSMIREDLTESDIDEFAKELNPR